MRKDQTLKVYSIIYIYIYIYIYTPRRSFNDSHICGAPGLDIEDSSHAKLGQ